MKIAIVEDLQSDRTILSRYIQKYAKLNHITVDISFYESGEEFLENARLSELDVVFLDIYMQALNGMEVAQKIRNDASNCLIVFVTTTDSFAVQSYHVNALYYLVKPFHFEAFLPVMKRVHKSLKTSSLYIEIKSSREMRKILLSNIILVDYYAHYVQIHTQDQMIRTYMKFAEIESMLLEYPEFLCCFRNIIINMNAVKKIDGKDFILINEKRVPINRSRSKEIKSEYADYMFNKLEANA